MPYVVLQLKSQTESPRRSIFFMDSSIEEEEKRAKHAAGRALTLEIVGDLPYASIKPPENVLFVCKLNPLTEEDDLGLIFSRFGPIKKFASFYILVLK